jgi:hypothetical protein
VRRRPATIFPSSPTAPAMPRYAAQHSTAQHSTAQHSTAQHSVNGMRSRHMTHGRAVSLSNAPDLPCPACTLPAADMPCPRCACCAAGRGPGPLGLCAYRPGLGVGAAQGGRPAR